LIDCLVVITSASDCLVYKVAYFVEPDVKHYLLTHFIAY